MPDGVPPKMIQENSPAPDGKPRFQGEFMICRGCSKMEKSDQNAHSNWTFLKVGDNEFYVCPKCFSRGRHIGILQTLLRDS